MKIPAERQPPFLFDTRHCELARLMKERGLPWTPHAGSYVFDPGKRIGAPSPFGGSVYFILDLKHFVRRLGSLEAVASKLVWLPTLDQAIWMCGRLGLDPSPAPSLLPGDRWLDPAEYLLVLYDHLLQGLSAPGGMEPCAGGDLRPALEMCGPLDRVEEKDLSGEGEPEKAIARLFASTRLAVLATLMGEQPYTNLVAFASSGDLRRLVFATTRPTRKYSNLSTHPLVSLLIDNRSNNPADIREAIAVCATGRATEAGPSLCGSVRDLYLSKHPYLREFTASPSCVFMVVEVDVYYMVRRFQNVTEVHMKP